MPSAAPFASLTDLVDLVLPRECGGCGAVGERCCPACRAVLAGASPRPWRPDPCPDGFPRAWAALPYEGPVRQLVVTWKDGGRRDLTPVLGHVLARCVAAAVADLLDVGLLTAGAARAPGAPGLLLVPAPSSRATTRQRGDRPLVQLCRVTARALPPGLTRLLPALRQGRAVADQAGLDQRARAVNLAGSMVLVPRTGRRVAGAHCLLVDDVVTTGATLAEAARVLRGAGARSVVAVTVAATRRWSAS